MPIFCCTLGWVVSFNPWAFSVGAFWPLSLFCWRLLTTEPFLWRLLCMAPILEAPLDIPTCWGTQGLKVTQIKLKIDLILPEGSLYYIRNSSATTELNKYIYNNLHYERLVIKSLQFIRLAWFVIWEPFLGFDNKGWFSGFYIGFDISIS